MTEFRKRTTLQYKLIIADHLQKKIHSIFFFFAPDETSICIWTKFEKWKPLEVGECVVHRQREYSDKDHQLKEGKGSMKKHNNK